MLTKRLPKHPLSSSHSGVSPGEAPPGWAHETVLRFRAVKGFLLKEIDQGRHLAARMERGTTVCGRHGGVGGRVSVLSGLPFQGECRHTQGHRQGMLAWDAQGPVLQSHPISANQAVPPSPSHQPHQVPPSSGRPCGS